MGNWVGGDEAGSGSERAGETQHSESGSSREDYLPTPLAEGIAEEAIIPLEEEVGTSSGSSLKNETLSLSKLTGILQSQEKGSLDAAAYKTRFTTLVQLEDFQGIEFNTRCTILAKMLCYPDRLSRFVLNRMKRGLLQRSEPVLDDSDEIASELVEDLLGAPEEEEEGEDKEENDEEFAFVVVPDELQVDELKPKFIITETVRDSAVKVGRKVISRLGRYFLPQAGIFHSALKIGPLLFEWTQSHLIFPNDFHHLKTYFVADVSGLLDGYQTVSEVVDVVCKVSARWNRDKMYCDSGSKSTHFGNCQDFVEDCLHALRAHDANQRCTEEELIFPDDAPLQRFVRYLRTTGNTTLRYQPNSSLRDLGVPRPEGGAFATHRQLDEFTKTAVLKYPEFGTHDDYALLKAFDRSFWLQLQRLQLRQGGKILGKEPLDEDDEQYQDLVRRYDHSPHGCPFGDPAVGFSLAYYLPGD